MLTLLAIIIPTVLEYICKLLKPKPPTRLYQELLNMPNIRYIVGKITKPKHEDLIFLVPDSDRISVISKTIIFVDNIEDIQYITKCFCLRLLPRLQNK